MQLNDLFFVSTENAWNLAHVYEDESILVDMDDSSVLKIHILLQANTQRVAINHSVFV